MNTSVETAPRPYGQAQVSYPIVTPKDARLIGLIHERQQRGMLLWEIAVDLKCPVERINQEVIAWLEGRA